MRLVDVQQHTGLSASLISKLDSMGQQLFSPPNVKGWPGGRSWLNTATVLARGQAPGGESDGRPVPFAQAETPGRAHDLRPGRRVNVDTVP